MKNSEGFCVVGLGNPGDRYKFTRHNAGFLLLDYLSQYYGSEGVFRPNYWISRGMVQNTPLFFLKPMEYMNLSGRAFREVMQYYKIPLSRSIVCYDDISFPLGEFRLKPKGSSGGHNGVASIIECMGTQEFSRLRLGIAPKDSPIGGNLSDFVLSPFREEERTLLEGTFSKIREVLEIYWAEGQSKAMNLSNRRD